MKKILYVVVLILMALLPVDSVPVAQAQGGIWINAGGGDYTDANGDLFVADKAHTAGDFGYSGGQATSTTTEIAGTTDDPLYQTYRTANNFSYLFDNLPADDYAITLYFVEAKANAAGKRVFDVTIEGVLALDDYDIFATAGGSFIAVTETVITNVSDGQLNIDFDTSINKAVISAIAVVSTTPPPPEPDIDVSPTTLDFGDVEINTSSDMDVVVSNIGTADLEVSALATTNPVFSIISPATPVTISPGNFTNVTVRFSPTATGPASGDLQITSDDPDEGLVSVPLTGNGIDPPPNDPDIDVTPLSLNYGQVEIGTSADQNVTINNTGLQDLTVSDLTTTNGVFTVVSPAVPFDVTPGNSQIVTVRFSPTTAQVENGDLQITSNDPDEGLVTVSLTGEGIDPPPNEPDIAVTPLSVDYGQVVVGNTSDQIVTISNTGIQTLNVSDLTTTNGVFSVVSPATPFSVAPSGSQDVTVRFSPTAEQVENGDLQITSDDPDEGLVTVTLTGEGITTPPLALRINAGGGDYTDINGNLFVADKAFTAGDFGYIGGQTKTYAGPVEGTSDDPLYEAVRLANASFSYAFDNLPAGSYEVTLYFTEPTANSAGQRLFDVSVEGVLVLDDYDIFTVAGGKLIAVTETIVTSVSDGQLNIDFNESTAFSKPIVSAIAVINTAPPTPQPDIDVSPTVLDYGDVEINTSSDLNVTVSNVGTVDLEVTGLSTTNGVFTVISPAPPVTIAPGNSTLVTVRFSPTAAGAQSGDLQISSDDPDEGLVMVSLSGNGTDPPPNEPEITVNPTSLSYGQVVIGNDSDLVVTIDNDGLQTLTVSDLTTTNATFSVVSPAVPFDVTPGGSQAVTVRFSPTAEQVETGDLQITSNDPDEGLVTVSLDGEGVTTPPLAFRINAGGGDYTDVNGNLFVADKAFTPGDFGYTDGATNTYPDPVSGTSDDALYQDVRLGTPAFNYTFDNLPSGTYQITLYFMEPTANNPGQRLIDVTVEGVFVLSSYDIFAAAGGKLIAITEEFTTDVTDGQLNIGFTANNKSIVSAIAVVSSTPPTPGPDINVSPSALNYGTVVVNTSSDLDVTVSNVGTTDLEVTALATTNPVFSVISPATPFIVSPGNSTNVTVRFSPTVEQAETGDLQITSDDPDEGLVTVSLDGTGGSVVSTTYQDVTLNVGLVPSHDIGATCNPPMGSGSAWADYDNDGDIDLFVTNRGGANHLYRNDGDTNSDGLPDFTDVAVAMGVDDPTGAGHSVVFIDYDNDGDQDLYVTNWGGNTLYENQLIETSTVSFIDVTSTAGIGDSGRAITTAWGDFDNDSYLDLYVAKHHTCSGDFISTDHLFHNEGDGTFTDVTSYLCNGSSTCFEVDGLGFAPGWLDYDNDGDQDLYLVNDSNGTVADNVLWRNDGSDGSGGWTFTDVSVAAGVNFQVNGMGLGVGDYDNDGWLDLAFSDIGPGHLLQNNGDGTFGDVSASSGVTALTNSVTWGTVFFDHDNDGWLDLYFVAGNTGSSPGDSYPNHFLGNQGDGTFVDLSASSGLDNEARGRNASIVDFDGDGFVDVFVGNYGAAPSLYHNRSIAQGNTSHWLSVTVEGTESNRDGIGTRLYLTAGGMTMMREISSGPTHGGGDYRAAYFGLGTDTSGTLTVHWPNGVVENLGTVTADQQLHLIEPPSTPPTTTYEDVTLNVGLVPSHDIGATCNPPLGSGSAWADYDNDGDIDLFVTNRGGANHLYRNDGDTNSDGLPDFTDVAVAMGVDDPTGAGHSVVFIDYDNDGDQDLYVTNWGGNTLYENQLIETSTVSFIDVTSTAGIGDSGRAITTAWGDFDNDSYLDLYVAKHHTCSGDFISTDHLFHNEGDGTFTDVTSYLCNGSSTCFEVDGLGFAPGWLDYDNDGDQDLYLVNDSNGTVADNVLWRNDGSDGSGGWTFTDVSVAAGVNFQVNGMGLGVGDYDNDGWLDLAFSDIGPGHLLQNNGDGTFGDVSASSNVTGITGTKTWGTVFFDHDNDGWLDLYFVAGNTGSSPGDSYPNYFLGNQGDGTFVDLSASSGLDNVDRGRNASIVDFDGDGFVDVFVGNYGAPPVLYHNRSIAQGNTSHWLSVTVEGTESNRDGIGTRLYLTAGGMTMMREISSGPTHGGGDYRAAYFGLGTDTSGTLTVHWPNGVVENLGTVTADQQLHLIEPPSTPPTTTYENVTADVGITLSHELDGSDCLVMLGVGSAWADYDNDGDLDLFATNHGGPNHLYRNDGDTDADGLPNFTDDAVAMGVDNPTGNSLSAVFIDYDNDGDQDLYVTNLGGNTLYENQLVETSSVSFVDVTATAGIADAGRAITTAWGDFDQDGYLDLYVTKHKNCNVPGDFQSQDHLFHNEGNGTFTDVTSYLCGGPSTCFNVEGFGFSPGWLDYDNDGDQDLYLVNDSNGSVASNILWRNDGSDGSGGWTFTDVSASSGTNFTVNGMGLGVGDYDNDGWLDIAFSDIGPAHLLHNNGDGTYGDVSASSGVTALTDSITWGTVFFDHDNDGWLDLYLSAGDTGPTGYPNIFLNNNSDGTFSDISTSSGLDEGGRGRNLSIADFDGDGFVDVFVGNFGNPPALLRNQATALGNTSHWLSVTVEGTESNRDGIGTRLYLTAGGLTMMREISSGPTHGGGDHRAAYFGLGAETEGTLEIHWPNGVVENLGTVLADKALHLVEPPSNTTFADVTAAAGLAQQHQLTAICPPPLGSGSAWADYDDDGDIDLFVTNHGGANWLYRNDGDTDADGFPNFVDEASAMGVDDPAGVGHSAVFIDYDNDGDQDLYVTNWGGNTLYENQLVETSSVSFVDVTATAGVADAGRAITTAWGDFDQDGYLDLYLAKHRECGGTGDPSTWQSEDQLYRSNGPDVNGDVTFTNVTSYLCGGAATCAAVEGFGFAPGWFDYDNDDDLDLYLVNDVIGDATWNVLWRNDGSDGSGGWLFTDVSVSSGADFKAHGMGLGVGDYDNDGWYDVAFSDVGPARLARNQGDGTFVETSGPAGVTAATNSTSWGTVFFDHDNDGWLDLFIAAGGITTIDYYPDFLLANQSDGTFADISRSSGVDNPGRGRSASIVDVNGDGYVELFVGNYGGMPALYHNRGSLLGNTNNWLSVTVEGTDSNRDGIGARLYLTAGGVTMMRDINSGPTHGGGDYRAAYFGLGSETSGTLDVHWPNGVVENLGTITAGQQLHLVEPAAP